MKNLIRFFIVIITGITITFISCNKDDNKSTAVTPTGIVGTTISGVVFNTNHMPISDVEVTVGTFVKTTGVDGSFLFENIPVSNDRYKVEFKKDNYFETYRTGKAEINGITKVEVSMVELNNTEPTTYHTTISTNAGGVLYDSSTPVDTILYYPPNLNYIRIDNNSSYTGNIEVYAKYVDASLPEYSQIVAGGDQFGRIGNSDYYLNSYSGIMVALFDDNGNRIDLGANNNESAEIHVKIPATMLINAPDSIDTWYNGGQLAYASNNGGSGRKNGGKYVSSVGHFSLWSMQTKFSSFGTITGRVTDCNGEPVNGVRVQVGQSYAITNNDGIYSREVAAGVDNITVQVLAVDYFGNASVPISVSSLTNGETRADIDINLPCVGTITGRLVNCSGSQVPGQVVVRDLTTGDIAKTYTENGYFELKFNQNSTAFVIHSIGYNNESTDTIYYAGFPYDAGEITMCPPPPPFVHVDPPAGSNNVTIDNTNYHDFSSANGTLYGNNLSLYTEGNDGYFSFEISNCTGTGTYPITGYTLKGTNNINSSAYIYVDTTYYNVVSGNIVITGFEDVGGRIIGNFSGTGEQGETISGEFNMQRNPNQQ